MVRITVLLGFILFLFSFAVPQFPNSGQDQILVLTTWSNVPANKAAMLELLAGGSALDGVESGIRVKEADAEDTSVGLGGLPDETGEVTLDACIMNHLGDAGSVTYLKNILHPISVARKVMESTDHVMLSGEGALEFAMKHGFEKSDLLTENARKIWENWMKSRSENPGNHDTIGMIAKDSDGNLSGGCSTSGLGFKMKGRVGDSPIIGAGLFVDNLVGAATATGVGEEVMKTLGSFLIVELMRNGMSPQAACEEAVKRIVARNNNKKFDNFHVGFIAMNKNGEIGAFSVAPGLEYTISNASETAVNKALSYSN